MKHTRRVIFVYNMYTIRILCTQIFVYNTHIVYTNICIQYTYCVHKYHSSSVLPIHNMDAHTYICTYMYIQIHIYIHTCIYTYRNNDICQKNLENLVVVAALISLVAKKVDFLETRFFHELQTVRLVPSDWEHVERNLLINTYRHV